MPNLGRLGERLGGVGDKLKKGAADMGKPMQRVAAARAVRHEDVFEGDAMLRKSLDDLEEAREHMENLWAAVDNHGKDMMCMAASERTLSQRLTSSASSIITTADRHLTKDRVTTQIALGAAEAQAAQTIQKFAQDMVDPMREVRRSIDDRYRGTVVVLKKRYISQKSDYLKYSRQIANTDDENKKFNLESLRDASRPIWEKTSASLKIEADKLVVEIIKEMNHYLVKLALVRRHTMLKISDSFKDAFDAASKVKL